MIACCWCNGACATGNAKIDVDQVVFCLRCGTMMVVVRRVFCLVTRPLTIDELSEQLQDSETMRILCEMEGGSHA